MKSKNIYSEIIDIEESSDDQKRRKIELKQSILNMLTKTPVTGMVAVETIALTSEDIDQK